MDTRILTTFPTEGQPSPCIMKLTDFRNFYDLHPPGRSATTATKLNRWFCCRCAERGYQDPVGIINYSDVASSSSSLTASSSYTTTSPPGSNTGMEGCWQQTCHHIKCPNCIASASHNVQDAIRTFGGLHASPRFIDPVYWGCPCGEWAKNLFSEAHATMGISLCANQACDFRYRSPQTGTLRPDSIVLNGYGQPLGTADQKIAVSGGPWHWQRMGLRDEANVLLDAFRLRFQQGRSLPHSQPQPPQQPPRRDGVPSLLSPAPGMVSNSVQRMLPPIPTASSSSSLSGGSPLGINWMDGEPAPRYPFRPPPPAPAPDWLALKSGVMAESSRKSSNSMDGAADEFESQELAYRTAYLAGIPRHPGASTGNSSIGIMSPPTGPITRPSAPRSPFPSGSSVGMTDHVQIQMPMQMSLMTPTPAVQDQVDKGGFPRW